MGRFDGDDFCDFWRLKLDFSDLTMKNLVKIWGNNGMELPKKNRSKPEMWIQIHVERSKPTENLLCNLKMAVKSRLIRVMRAFKKV